MHRTKTLLVGLVGVVSFAAAAISLAAPSIQSGVPIGGMLSAYHPVHVSGPDKQTNTCPVCNYPFNPAVQVWVNGDNAKNVASIAGALEKTARANADKKLKVFVVFINPSAEPGGAMAKRLEKIADDQKLQYVSLVYLPGPKDEAVSDYQINTNPQVKNTVFVYKNRKVAAKFINLAANDKDLGTLNGAIRKVLQ